MRRVAAHRLAQGHGVVADPLDEEDVAVGDAVAMVVFPGDDKIAAARLGALSEPYGRAVLDQAEVDQVVADPAGQFAAAFPVGGDQQDVLPGEPFGDRGADRVVHDLFRVAAADPAVIVVLAEDGGVPGAQPQAGRPFPLVLEPDRLGQLDVAVLPRQQPHPAAALDGGELLLVPGDQHLAVQVVGQADDPGQVIDRHHGRLVDDDQRPGRRCAAGARPWRPGRRTASPSCKRGSAARPGRRPRPGRCGPPGHR